MRGRVLAGKANTAALLVPDRRKGKPTVCAQVISREAEQQRDCCNLDGRGGRGGLGKQSGIRKRSQPVTQAHLLGVVSLRL